MAKGERGEDSGMGRGGTVAAGVKRAFNNRKKGFYGRGEGGISK